MNITETIEFWQEVQQDFQRNATTSSSYLCGNSRIFVRQWHNNNIFIRGYASLFLNEYPQFKKDCYIGDGLLFVYSSSVVPNVPQTWRYEIRETFLKWIINYLTENDKTTN